MEHPKSTTANIPVSTASDTTGNKPKTKDLAKAAAQKLDNRIAGQRNDFSGASEREAKESARSALGASFGSYRKPSTPGSKDFKKTKVSSNSHLTKMPASLGSNKRSSVRSGLSSSREEKRSDLDEAPTVPPRSSHSDFGLSPSDAAIKARARASFFSSPSMRLEISELEAKSKSDSSEFSRSMDTLPANANSRKPKLVAANQSSRDIFQKTPNRAFASTSSRRLMRAVSKRSVKSSMSFSTKESPADITASGLTNVRDLDELIAYKTGIPLDDEETEARPMTILGRKRPVTSRNFGKSGSSTREIISSLSTKRITSGMDLEERIAYKTGIPLDTEDKQPLHGAEGSSNSVHMGSEVPQKSHERHAIRNHVSIRHSASRSGITSSRNLDELIAYKTGIPLDDETEEEKIGMSDRSNSSKKASGSLGMDKSANMMEFNSSVPMLGSKLGYYPKPDGGKESFGDVEDLRDTNDLAVATEVLEETEDAFIPSAIEYDPEAKPPIYKNRRFRLYSALTACLFVVVIFAVVGMLASEQAKDKSQPNTSDPGEESDLGIRAQLELVVGAEQLNDPESSHYRAMMWLMNDDRMQVGTKDANLVQRFLLASFYIQSRDHGEWRSCNAPNATVTEDTCFYQQLVDVYPQKFRSIPSQRWLSGEHECQWAGLECDESDYVRTIDLLGQNIGGNFPVELTHLRFLQGIRLNLNDLTGTIPEEYGMMPHLVHLELHFNSLTGSIPRRWSESRNLQAVNIGENFLTGTIPPGVREMVNLKGLFLFGNILTGDLPSSLGDITMLKYVRLHNNRLSGSVPSEIGSLYPEEIWLHKQPISGSIPSQLGNLGNIKDLRLYSSSLNGTIPEELYRLSQLSRLDLSNAHLTGTLSTRIGQMESLNILKIHDNELFGSLPTALGEISDLSSLWVHGNNFSGEVPIQLCYMRGSDGLAQLVADCLPSNTTGVAQNSCTCCDTCCDVVSGVCQRQDA